MKFLNRLAWVALVLCALGILATLMGRNTLVGQGELSQLVKPADPAVAALTGDVGAFIGEPQVMIITDPKAILPGKAPDGARLVDQDYLRRQGIYPLQVKTVVFAAKMAMYGFGGGALIALIGGLWTGKRLAARAS